jgi:hypothetical protein
VGFAVSGTDGIQWRRSKRGNLWALIGGKTCTVFPRRDGSFAWCVHDGQKPRYLPVGHATEAAARAALLAELAKATDGLREARR